MLMKAEAEELVSDIRILLRILFEPYARVFLDSGNISYVKLTSWYLNHARPLGVRHPADYRSTSTGSSRAVIDLLDRRMSFLGRDRVIQRLESVSALFFATIIQHYARHPGANANYRPLFEDILEMAAAAFSAPPWPQVTDAAG
jgi:hypothetical protein